MAEGQAGRRPGDARYWDYPVGSLGVADRGATLIGVQPQIPAGAYDEMIGFASHPPETDQTVAGVRRLLPAGARLLELGVGTGRLAIPLAAAGLEVHGVDLDPAALKRLRAKPSGAAVHVHQGDMSAPLGAGCFDLVLIAFGSLFALPTQADQVRCFASAAAQLTDDGRFVVEALVPRPETYQDGQKVVVAQVGDAQVVLNVASLDPVGQVVTSQQVLLADDRVRLFPNRIRYAWPAELDLMARLAGLELAERWADWQATPFERDSPRHVSIYRREATR